MLGAITIITTPALKPSVLRAKVENVGELGGSNNIFTQTVVDTLTNATTKYEGVELTGLGEEFVSGEEDPRGCP